MPSQLLKQCIEKLNESGLEELLQTPASLNVAETQPGQMSLTALTAEEEEPGMSVQSLLDIGESEATLLWDATEQEDFEREDFEEDRCHQHDAGRPAWLTVLCAGGWSLQHAEDAGLQQAAVQSRHVPG